MAFGCGTTRIIIMTVATSEVETYHEESFQCPSFCSNMSCMIYKHNCHRFVLALVENELELLPKVIRYIK